MRRPVRRADRPRGAVVAEGWATPRALDRSGEASRAPTSVHRPERWRAATAVASSDGSDRCGEVVAVHDLFGAGEAAAGMGASRGTADQTSGTAGVVWTRCVRRPRAGRPDSGRCDAGRVTGRTIRHDPDGAPRSRRLRRGRRAAHLVRRTGGRSIAGRVCPSGPEVNRASLQRMVRACFVESSENSSEAGNRRAGAAWRYAIGQFCLRPARPVSGGRAETRREGSRDNDLAAPDHSNGVESEPRRRPGPGPDARLRQSYPPAN